MKQLAQLLVVIVYLVDIIEADGKTYQEIFSNIQAIQSTLSDLIPKELHDYQFECNKPIPNEFESFIINYYIGGNFPIHDQLPDGSKSLKKCYLSSYEIKNNITLEQVERMKDYCKVDVTNRTAIEGIPAGIATLKCYLQKIACNPLPYDIPVDP